MTDSGNDSESGNSSSAGGNGSSPFLSSSSNLTAGGRLARLLVREQELIASLEQLNRDIEQLETSDPGADQDDDAKSGDGSSSVGGSGGGGGAGTGTGAGVGDDENGGDEDEDALEEFEAPEWCVPIKANVMTYDWDSLAAELQFDVILMDPPWQLATHAPTRGVAIAYQQLPDVCIEELPIPKLSANGFIFIWVINNKYTKAFDLMRRWGYRYVDDITWVKQTVNRRMAKGHGYYLQHAKETCLVGKKGDDPPGCRHSIGSDVIFSERRGQSQKPEELYELIEELVPNGQYLEIFGRKNNLRDYWVTVGNEL
ncbi:MT-A70-domain-containing protein [Mortierella sp. GBAus27b]|nr:MT-A70-domain-containing protein [Mortierella sp. GBAus27b]